LGAAQRGIRAAARKSKPAVADSVSAEVGDAGGSHLRGPPVSGRWRQGAAGACWGAGVRGARLLRELGRCWAVRERGGRCPFFYFKTDFLLFLSCSKTQTRTTKQIKQNKCSSMNAFKHVSTLYFILFNFVNYLINAKEIQTKPKIKSNLS